MMTVLVCASLGMCGSEMPKKPGWDYVPEKWYRSVRITFREAGPTNTPAKRV